MKTPIRESLKPHLAPLLAAIILTALPALGAAQMKMGMPMAGKHKSGSFADMMASGMKVMDRNMMSAPMTGNPDHDFASMMIPHHQGAIEMAKAELLYGKDPVLRRLAQEIVATQNEEITLMRRSLDALAAKSRKQTHGSRPLRIAPPSYSHDRVYTGDQVSNTVSVIDPGTNKLLGLIRLGDPVPGALSPLYRGQLLVHGLGFSPDGKTLVVVSIGSNSLTFISTATNRVLGTLYVGRAPHEAFFTPNGKEVWCAVRGVNYVSVVDPVRRIEKRRIVTTNGPGMVLFSPDGRYAFVPSSFVPEFCVIDTRTYKVIARRKQFSPFSPNLAVSRDGKEVWITLKDSGKTQVYSGKPPFNLLATIDSGPITNHVTTVDNPNGHFAYVTVGGQNVVKVYRRGPVRSLVATIPTGDLPHGIWGSPDGLRVYIGLENGGGVQAIDTTRNKVIANMPSGQLPQALVYVPNAIPTGTGLQNLVPLASAGEASHLSMTGDGAVGNVVVNSLGLVDSIQLAASGLSKGKTYELQLVDSLVSPTSGATIPLVRFTANPAGGGLAQTIGPLRTAISSAGTMDSARRYLQVVDVKTGAVILKQRV